MKNYQRLNKLKLSMRTLILMIVSFHIQPLLAESTTNFSLFSHLHYNRFEQQIKNKVGGEKGDLLTEDNEVSIHLGFEYLFKEHWRFGLFLRFDNGTRELGEYGGINADTKPNIVNKTGGTFSELWLGPYAGYRYSIFAVDLGYGLLGLRDDAARDDIKDFNKPSGGYFETSLSVAWFISAGITAPLLDNLDLSLRLEYRIRYYELFSGEELVDSVAHGTQDITPFFGVHWKI